MSKLLLVAMPLALYAIAYGVRSALGRRPSMHALNVEVALLLVLYFLATASLGIFWVANQQLPPFDLHYLFGYATFVLVMTHLVMNAKIVFAYFRKGPRAAKHPIEKITFAKAAFAFALAGGAFFLGLRAGSPRLPASLAGATHASVDAVTQYHAISSHTRTGVVLRAPSVAWDLPVAKYIERPDRPHITLEAPNPSAGSERSTSEALAATPRKREGRFDRRDLTTVLWATAGITDRRGGHDLRASASSGALFPTEIYVVAYDVEGLAPSVYAYAPKEHALADLGRPAIADAKMGLSTRPNDNPEAAIVVTSVLRRTGQKYRDRAYRYAVADAGHAVGNAIIAAAEVGMGSEIIPAFDDAFVAEVVGVDNQREAVVAVIALRNGAPPSIAATSGLFAPSAIPNADDLELGATGLAHVATSLSWTGASVDDDGAERLSLPTVASPPSRMLELIARRRSARNFQAGSLKLEDLSGVLGSAAGAPPAASRAVRVHLVASRIDGLPPGTFVHDPAVNALVRKTSGDVGGPAGRAALDQNVVGNAPAAVVLTLDRRALAGEGARGYRNAFLEAGIVGARLYLASAAHGLGGCSVGAFYDEEAAALLGIDLADEWPIHFFALGTPE